MSTWPSTSTRCRSRGAGMPTSMACTATPTVITATVSSFNTFCKLTWTQNRRSHAYTTATPGGLRLVRDDRLRGFHGGVGSLYPQEMLGRDHSMAEAKHAIAERALSIVGPNEVIALDAGTTATQLAALLPKDQGTRVVTHSFSAVSVLAGLTGIEVNCLGGDLHYDSLSFAGPSTLAAISNLQIETMFLAASGLNERGAFCATGFDAITKRALIEVSAHLVLIADSSKFGIPAMVKVCGWDVIDTVIIDAGITSEQQDMLVQAGVAVQIV